MKERSVILPGGDAAVRANENKRNDDWGKAYTADLERKQFLGGSQGWRAGRRSPRRLRLDELDEVLK